MMRKIETFMVVVILAPIPPILGLLAFWWSAVAFIPETFIPPLVILGFILGLVVDAIYLKRWIGRAYAIPWTVWLAIYLFYSIGVFGFFMGVPAFNLGLALPAGFVVGVKLVRQAVGGEQARGVIRQACACTTVVLALLCAASAFLALTDPYTAANLEGMLKLEFQVTQPMIIGLIILGGVMLLALQWSLTAAAARWTMQHAT